MDIVTRHGWLLNVFGVPRYFDGIWFAPVCGEVDEAEAIPIHLLQEYETIIVHCEGFQLGDADGVWVRAAIPSVFGYAPLHVSDGRWFLLNTAFVAVLPETEKCLAAYPFACTDDCQSTGLVFSRLGPPSNVRERIARAFWCLLLAGGAQQLSEFKAPRVGFDTGDGYDSELLVGYSRGEFYAEDMRDSECEEDTVGSFDEHVAWLAGETRLCPECGGSGEESFLPAGEVCELCVGTGWLN
jgi:hypothetical protein